MMDAARIKNISSNYIRAQQAESDGDDRAELRYLLFAAQDIAELLLIEFKEICAQLEQELIEFKEICAQLEHENKDPEEERSPASIQH
jgi:hypothetical protein